MKRLDDPSFTRWNRWVTYIFLITMWVIMIRGSFSHPDRVLPVLYGLLPISLLIHWWLSGFKEVSIGSAMLKIRDSKKEALIPLTLVARVVERPWNKGLAHITLVFRSETAFGRRVRIMTGARKIESISSNLRSSIERKEAPNQSSQPRR